MHVRLPERSRIHDIRRDELHRARAGEDPSNADPDEVGVLSILSHPPIKLRTVGEANRP
jgi:hypothetical protein